MHRILVLRGGALGDFIVTLPALAALRSRWPEARIELAGNAIAARLALNRGVLNAVHSQHESRWAPLFSAEPLAPEFQAWLASFDLVLNYWPDADGELARHFPGRAGQVFISTAAPPTRGPACAHYAEPLRAFGIELSKKELWFPLSPEVERVISDPPLGLPLTDDPESNGRVKDNPPYLDSARIAIHPGSGSPKKNWPLARWIELCRRLRETRAAELLIVTGEVESPATCEALGAFGRELHSLPLEELIVELAQCRLFVGHDSGVSHLAAACGVPSVLLFGPTDPTIWAPLAEHVHVIRKGTALTDISVGDVQAALSRPL